MMMLLRTATGLARNRTPEHRWRKVSVPASALLFMFFLLAATSVVVMVVREGDRDTARTAQVATTASSTDLFLLERPDRWHGQTISVVWMEPASPDVEPVLPPGVETLPAPGQAVVSPALDRLVTRHPDLATRYRDRLVLDSTGVRGGGELIAYIRAPAGRSLGGEHSAVRVEDGRVVGEGPVFRISGFGSPSEATISRPVGQPVSPTPTGPVVGGLLGVLVVPGLILLAVGVAAASEVRDHRFAVLRSIGARARTVTTLAVLETLVLAVPGLAAAAVLWTVIGPRLTTVPLVGYEVVRGDLGLPWWLLFGQLSAAIAATALVSALVTAVPRRRAARPRPTPRRPGFAAVRAVPLVVAVAAFTLGKLDGGYRAADLYLLGMVSAVAGVPAVLPGVLRGAGMVLGRVRSMPAALAGRTMAWDPARAARPFVGGAALLVLVLTGSGYVALSRDVDDPWTPPGPHAVAVEWRDPRPGDLARLADEVGVGLVAPVVEGEPLHGEAGGGLLSIGATCSDLAAYFADTSCDSTSQFALPVAIQRHLAERLVVATHGPVTQARLVPREDLEGVGSAFVLAEAPLEAIEERARSAAMTVLPAPYVQSLLSTSRESPLVPWVIAGAVIAAIGLAVACLLSLVDRLLAARRQHRHLVNLGISRNQLTTLGAWMFAVPYSAVFVVSLLAGLSVCALLILPGAVMPWDAIGTTMMVAIAVGLLGTVGVAFLGAKGALKERE